jgi:phosphoribosylaminoimidazole carboxylase PurK protein
MKIGILGGGQLGRMLWQASTELSPNLQPSPVFHDTKFCPAGAAGAPIVEGKTSDEKALSEFLSSCDTFAIENEFLPLDQLEMAWQAAKKSSQVPRPSLQGLSIAQDKFRQKKFFLENSIPTSQFIEITNGWLANDAAKLVDLHQRWNGLVLKKARMGYDGKGNLALVKTVDVATVTEFCQSAFAASSAVYAEAFVPFTKEVALVSVRSHSGEFGHYPMIETVQQNGVCLLAFTALSSDGIDISRIERQAKDIARIIGDRLQLLGTFAVEFFVTKSGELLVNEMAPRVHNSGHFTLRAAASSQFAMHLKSYWQKTFNPADFLCAPAFAMINLLGPAGVHKKVGKPAMDCDWYDKETTSPGRKLGHIIAKGTKAQDVPALIAELKASQKKWQESLTGQ